MTDQTRRLKNQDFKDAAAIIGCTHPVVMAVAEVESSGDGFGHDGRPTILFEAHWFSKLTGRVWDGQFAMISAPKWDRKLYTGSHSGEWGRFELAEGLNKLAAIQSASWGMFQIMGFNYKACGFQNPEDFRYHMELNEREHLFAFVKFVLSKGLRDELVACDWPAFARQYNGPGYKENRYDEKLEAAYKKWNRFSHREWGTV
jgi:hypothetical protein